MNGKVLELDPMHSRLGGHGPGHHIAISEWAYGPAHRPGTRPNDVVVAGFLSRAQDALEVSPSTCDPLGQSLHPPSIMLKHRDFFSFVGISLNNKSRSIGQERKCWCDINWTFILIRGMRMIEMSKCSGTGLAKIAATTARHTWYLMIDAKSTLVVNGHLRD